VYAFFRSRTLGYDVYPEDYFLPNFPWQQYGGLWICDDARFARAEGMDALSALALRRITGEGASPRSNSVTTSPTSSFANSGIHHTPPVADPRTREDPHTQPQNFLPSLDGSSVSYISPSQHEGSSPIFNMGSLHATLSQNKAMRPDLSLLTDIGRKYPGFPTPLSPTLSAKDLFPSPSSDLGSPTATPRPLSPMSLDGSEMCGPSRRCTSHSFVPTVGLIDSILHAPSTVLTSLSPTSPTSPRCAMLQNMRDKQTCYSPTSTTSSNYHNAATRYIHIANGTETSTQSPISPHGMMLTYTSHRPVTSGLLGVRPLSETDVAEYRFWSPCGKRGCAFGCGGAREGEWAAAKRLFREAEDVDRKGGEGEMDGGYDAKGYRASEWAGGRKVGVDWKGFLGGCERDGVARF
jgi:hypothetical protein